MNRYAVVGRPVRHSLSPWIHSHFARQTQRAVVYAAFAADDFAATAQNFFNSGGRGLNITAPFKKDALQFATRASAFAKRAEAANVLTMEDGQVSACNTDGAGLIRDLECNLKFALSGRRVLIAGAGGAARAAALALSARDAKIVIAARKPKAANDLAKLVGGESASLSDCGGGYDLVINAIPGNAIPHGNDSATSGGGDNATSGGGDAAILGGGESPLPSSVFAGAKLAYDLNYGKAAAAFLHAAAGATKESAQKGEAAKKAAAKNCAVAKNRVDGAGMLVEQAALSFAIWESIMPTTAGLIQTLRCC